MNEYSYILSNSLFKIRNFLYQSIGLLGHDVVELIETEIIVVVGLVQNVGIVHHLGDLIII